jgi:hypothetical protein
LLSLAVHPPHPHPMLVVKQQVALAVVATVVEVV